jgi:hypothetical protein
LKHENNRYNPITQKRYCCVPESLLMVMERRGIPQITQDELGYELGLTVPQEEAGNYTRVRTGEKPSSGWGTQIQNPKYEINKALAGISVPLTVEVDTDIQSAEDLGSKLQAVQDADGDALLCFDWGKLWDEDVVAGHVSVFDRLEGDVVHLIDPQPHVPKLRTTTIQKLYESMKFHGPANMAGVWNVSDKEA